MRKGLLLLAILANSLLFAQQQLPNGSFEVWSETTHPDNWGTLSSLLVSAGYASEDTETQNTNTAYITEGTSSILLETKYIASLGEIYPGGVAYGGFDANGYGTRMPFSSRPDSISISLAYFPQGGDSGVIHIEFSKNGTTIGGGYSLIPPDTVFNTMHSYTIPINYELSYIPDSIYIEFASSSYNQRTVGSKLYIDDVRFVGYNADTSSTSVNLCDGYGDLEALGYLPTFQVLPDSFVPHTWVVYLDTIGHSALAQYSPQYTWYWGDGDSSIGITPTHIYSNAGYHNICLKVILNNGFCSSHCDSSTYIFKTDEVITVKVVETSGAISAISETKNSNSISIFPNPSNGKFTLTSNITERGLVEVYNITGAKILSQDVSSLAQTNIDISNQASGIYLVKVSNAENVWTQRVVVK